MSQELFYTSAPKGLKPGSSGFCTVGVTAGMPGPLAERLELLSGYRPIYPAGDPSAARNPVIYAHWRVSVGGKTSSVLSRVAFAGFDHTRRSNKFAHHIVLDASEQAAGGPAWVMMQPGVMGTSWMGEPRIIPAGRAIPRGDSPPAPCTAWKAITGDAGWAGVLAETFVLDQMRPTYILFEPGTELLPLINESIALLPTSLRWQVTFSTYFTDLPSGLSCVWRCCTVDSPAAIEATRSSNSLVINLNKRAAEPVRSPFVSRARNPAASNELAGSQLFAPIAPTATLNDVMPESPSDAAVTTRKRLLAADRASRDSVEAWMPPLGATVVEDGESDSAKPFRRTRFLISIVAIGGWIVAAIALAFAVLERRGDLSAAVPIVAPTTSSTELENSAELSVKLRAVQEDNDRLLREWLSPDAVEQRIKEVEKALADKQRDLDTANQNHAELQTKLQKAESKLAAAQVPSTPIPTAAANPTTVPSLPPDPLDVVRVIKLPKSPSDPKSGDTSVDIFDSSGIGDFGHVELLFADGSERAKLSEKDEYISCKRSGNTITLVRHWKYPYATPPNDDREEAFAEIALDGSIVKWSWKKELGGNSAAALDRALRAMVIRLKGGTGPTDIQLQFIEPLRASWSIADNESITPPAAADFFPSAYQPNLALVQNIDPWTVQMLPLQGEGAKNPAQKLRLNSRRSSASIAICGPIDIEWRPATNGFQCNLKEMLRQYEDDRKKAQIAIDDASTTIKNIEDGFANQAKSPELDTKKSEATKQFVEARVKAIDRLANAQEALREGLAMKPFYLVVRLPNGVILERIRVSSDVTKK